MTLPAEGLHLNAPAKINLGLEILRRRPDGYHDLNTMFVAVSLYDELRLQNRSDGRITLTIEGADGLAADASNLCVRAAELLRAHAGNADSGLDIHLSKRIPMGAGLGGGSSDAAAVLKGAAELWGINSQAREQFSELALQLGSDVPFFLGPGMALGASRGEVLCPVPVRLPWTVLLVNPGIHVPTPWAYAQVGRSGERMATDLRNVIECGMDSPELLRETVLNDFEPAVFAAHPLLGEIKERMYRSGAVFALMSGSGSTMFGLFSDAAVAERARESFSEWWTAVVVPV